MQTKVLLFKNFRLSIILGLVISVFIIIQQSCKKSDITVNESEKHNAVEKFLTASSNANPIINRIIETVKKQEEKYHFLNKIITNEGFAKWESAKIIINKPNTISTSNSFNSTNSTANLNSDTAVLIPLILANTKYVNSFIVCKLDGGVTIRMIRGREYPNYGFNSSQDSINAQKVSMACMALEYESYGHDKFDIKDNRLFNYLPSNGIWKGAKLKIRPKSSNQPLTTQNVGGGMVTIFFSYEIEIEFENPFGVICPAGQSCNWVYTATVYDNYTFWMEGDPSGNPNPWPENPWTNGYAPCNGIPCTPVIEAWQYIEAPASVSLNQSIIDSLRGYPCAQSILAQLPGINNEVQTMLAVFVNNSIPVDIKFSIDSSLVGTLTNGYTRSPAQIINGVFTVTVGLNPWVLTHATREYIFATLLHESLHAFMDYQWRLFQTFQTDTATFKASYPIFYDYRRIGGLSLLELAQHQEMTFRYISFMSNALNSFNPNITYHTANQLAWEGLRETTLWHINYNDTTSINNTNNIARDTSTHYYDQFPYLLTTCP